MKNLMIVFLSFMLVTSVSEARSKRHKQRMTKKYNGKRNKKPGKNYSFTYDKIWFAHLTPRQQSIYLKTILKLAVQISKSKGKYSFNHPIMSSLLPSAFADEYFENNVISNGYMRPRKTSFEEFFEDMKDNFGELAPPSCPEGQYPCAPYLGLVPGPNGGLPVLACSKDNTASCARKGDIGLLKSTLDGCESNKPSANYCGKLNAEMGRVTNSVQKNVEKWCAYNSGKPWCKAADKAFRDLEKDDVIPPKHEEALSRGNCAKLAAKVAAAKEKKRPEDAERVYNNKFWKDMAKLSRNRKVCSNGVRTDMGVCNVKPDDKNFDLHKVDKYEYKEGENNIEFNKCKERESETRIKRFKDTIENLKRKIRSMEQKLNNNGNFIQINGSGSEVVRRLKEKLKSEKRELEKYKNRLEEEEEKIEQFKKSDDPVEKSKDFFGKDDCTEQTKTPLTIGERGSVDNSDLQNLLDQNENPPSSETTRDKEERLERINNLFKSITGLGFDRFKGTFCKVSKQKPIEFYIPRQEEEPETNNKSLQEVQATNSLHSLQKCVSNLKTVEEVGCSFKAVYSTRGSMLRTASEQNPILVQSKNNPDQCRLIVEHKEIEGTEDEFLRFEKENGVISTRNVSLPKVASQYNIKVYTCHHDKVEIKQTGGDGPEETDDALESSQ